MNLNDIHDENFHWLGEQIIDAMERFRVPGVAVGVLHQGQSFTAGFGVTSVEHPLPVDGDTLFQIGSTTKTFTATLAMRLVEMGKLDLDAPIRKYLPEFRLRDESVAARVTMRHLLTHMGGWLGDYFDDLGDNDDALSNYVDAVINLPQLTLLNTIWSYNNAGFAVAGRVIEIVTGRTYEAALKELLLEPLGLEQSYIFPKDVMTHRFAIGHLVVNDKPKIARPWALARTAHCVGGIVSSANDQLRYARFHMSDGAPLLSRQSIAFMQTPQVPAALDDKMGLAWFINNAGGTPIVRHGGATLGQLSAFMFVPTRGFAITVLTNSSRGGELHNEITALALERYLGIKTPARVFVPMLNAQLAEFAGRYTSALADVDFKIENNELVMHTTPHGGFPAKDSPPGPTPPPSRFAFIGTDRIISLDGWSKNMQGEFLRGADGTIAWFRFGSRIREKVKQ